MQKPRAVAYTESEQLIVSTLRDLVPSAAASLEQAIADLADRDRVSYRGPAVELREAMREVLDHLAPDAAVMKSPGFKLEKNRDKPTMKQKVRFILKARGRSSSTISSPEDAADTVDSAVGALARSVYTHGSGTKKDVVQLKRYVEVVLLDILEL